MSLGDKRKVTETHCGVAALPPALQSMRREPECLEAGAMAAALPSLPGRRGSHLTSLLTLLPEHHVLQSGCHNLSHFLPK